MLRSYESQIISTNRAQTFLQALADDDIRCTSAAIHPPTHPPTHHVHIDEHIRVNR